MFSNRVRLTPDSLLHRFVDDGDSGRTGSIGWCEVTASHEWNAERVEYPGPIEIMSASKGPSSGGSVDRALTLMREPPGVTGLRRWRRR